METPTFALVLETNNLTGAGANTETIVRSLARLLRHLSGQTFGLTRLERLVITHDGPLEDHRALLEAEAGRDLDLVTLRANADYYEAKNTGFARTTADVVAFGDADCWPEPQWLESLFGVFDDATTRAVAGRTTYRRGVLGSAASTIDFMYFTDRSGRRTRNFYANNVAFRRDVFEQFPFPLGADLYKGNCQLLGARLAEEGIEIRFVPAARTVHRLPDSVKELLELRLLRGRDLRRVSPRLVASHGPRWLFSDGPPKAVAVPAVWVSRLGFSLSSFGRQDMPTLGAVGAAVAPFVMMGLSAVDAVGALGGGDRVWRTKQVLGYHSNRDDLEEGALHFGS